MKKDIHVYTLMAGVAAMAMTACSDELPVTQSDETTYISFSANAATQTEYETYPAAGKTPKSIAVFGYAGFGASEESEIFKNVTLSYSDSKWSYTSPKKWGLYTYASNFAFVGAVPSTGTTITHEAKAKTMTLSALVDLGESNITADDDAALISNVPATPAFSTVVPLKMDRGLCGYQVKFKLGSAMGALRSLKINSVKMYGSGSDEAKNLAFANKGTMSRTYTLDSSGKWSASDITWAVADGAKINKTKAQPFSIAHSEASLAISSADTEAKVWGSPFYIIPMESFVPTIVVNYDVVMASDDTVETRKGITSTIVFGSGNFSSYNGTPAPGKLNTILINIVPSYLYVLADSDQKQGYLVLNTQ